MGNSESSASVGAFGATSTDAQVLERFSKDLQGTSKHVVITGANSGLGFQLARDLASLGGWTIVLACRSKEKGLEAVESIKKERPNAKVEFLPLDLSSLASVKAFAAQYTASKWPLHILVNNAGIMACPQSFTADGVEAQFGTNHLGHFLLTKLLLPVIAKSGSPMDPPRIINVSSRGHYWFTPLDGPDFDDLELADKKEYLKWERYGISKMCNIWFANRLQRMYPDLICTSLHPGNIISTNLMPDYSVGTLAGIIGQAKPSGAVLGMMTEGQKSLEQGTATMLLCCIDPNTIRGAYYCDCAVATEKTHPLLHDVALEDKLWQFSEDLLKKKGIEV